MELLATGSSFLLIFVGFCFLILVHELGHFLAAKWAGIRVDGFSVGMGPPVLSWRSGIGWRLGSTEPAVIARTGKAAPLLSDEELARHRLGETEWAFRAVPIGGYVRMLGQEDANPAAVSDHPRSYQSCSIGKRMVVVSAGVIANLVLAVLLFLISFLVGVRFNAPIVGDTLAGLPAATTVASNLAEAGLPASTKPGLLPGDHVLSIDGEGTQSFIDVALAAAMGRPDESLRLVVQRPGVEMPLQFSMTPKRDETTGLLSIGVDPAFSTTITTAGDRRDKAFVTAKLVGTGLAAEGVTAGMSLIEANGQPIGTLDELIERIRASDGKDLAGVWSAPSGSTVEAAFPIQPALERVLVPSKRADGRDEVEECLLGMSPLWAVEAVPADSQNADRLQPGDLFLRLGTIDAPSLNELRSILQDWTEPTIRGLLRRDGHEIEAELRVQNGTLGFLPRMALETPTIGRVIAEVRPGQDQDPVPTPVASLDLFRRSTILEVGSHPVEDWRSLRAALVEASAPAIGGDPVDIPITFALPVGGATETRTFRVTAKEAEDLAELGWRTPVAGIFDPKYVTLKADGPLDAVRMGLRETKKMVLQVYLTIDRLMRRTVGIDQLHGPVGIFHVGTKVADQGFMYLVFFLAAISVNLAVMNFLPLPIVDGGLFLFLIYERFRGRPPSIAFQNAATIVGLALIGSLFLVTFYNDIARLLK